MATTTEVVELAVAMGMGMAAGESGCVSGQCCRGLILLVRIRLKPCGPALLHCLYGQVYEWWMGGQPLDVCAHADQGAWVHCHCQLSRLGIYREAGMSNVQPVGIMLCLCYDSLVLALADHAICRHVFHRPNDGR